MGAKQVTQPTVKLLNLVLNSMTDDFKKEKFKVIIVSKNNYKKLCRELHYKLKFYKGIKIISI